MNAKTQMVALQNDVLNVTEEFTINHAERILKIANNGGWKLPNDSAFKFDKNGIGIREDNKGDNGAKEKSNDKPSNSAAKQD